MLTFYFLWCVFNSNNAQNINPGAGVYPDIPPLSCGCASEYNTLEILLLNDNMTCHSRKIKVSSTSLKLGIKMLHISIIEPFLSITLVQPEWGIRNKLAPINTISLVISSHMRLFEGHFAHWNPTTFQKLQQFIKDKFEAVLTLISEKFAAILFSNYGILLSLILRILYSDA